MLFVVVAAMTGVDPLGGRYWTVEHVTDAVPDGGVLYVRILSDYEYCLCDDLTLFDLPPVMLIDIYK